MYPRLSFALMTIFVTTLAHAPALTQDNIDIDS